MSVASRTGVEAMPVELRQVGREPLHERVAAEGDDPRDVLVLLRREALPQVREGLLAARRPHRVGQVHDVDHGQAVHRQHELEPGQREHERGEQREADGQRRPTPPHAQPPPGRRVERDDHADEQREQQQSQRRVEADAHQAPLPAGRDPRNRAASPRRSRASVSRS